MRIVLAGSSGFLGSHLVPHLTERGHTVTRLVRSGSASSGSSAGPGTQVAESRWDPYADLLDQDVIDAADVVINLAGSPLLGNPHSKKWAADLVRSRVTTTRVLADRIATSHRSGAGRPAFVAGNGISIYGDHGDQVVDERSDSEGEAFLTGVTRLWEEATAPAADAGARVAILRTAPVIDRANPPLKPMLLPFRLGLGARLGDGCQFFPVISRRDWVGGVTHLVEHEAASGPFNLCCPETPTNAEYTHAVADAVDSRARLAVPRQVLRTAAGRMAPEVLGSIRAVPTALQAAGYAFRDVDVRDVVAAALK